MFDLTGKNAVITGSSKGIGKSIAVAMAKQGANVVISSRKVDVCEATAEEINDQKLVSELTVNELKEIVKVIVEETIEKCVVTGTMEGRAKLNLAVEGEVVAKMTCEFES